MMNRKRASSVPEKALDPGLSPLMIAILDKDVELVRALLYSGADLEVRDRHGRNALYHAFPIYFCEKALEILELLLDHQVNINASLDSDGCSALLTAVEMNESHVVSLLVSHGVDVDDPAMSKFCGSLSTKTANRNASDDEAVTTQFFFSKGCEHNVTPLLCAVMCRNHAIAEMLLEAGAGTNCISSGSFWRAANVSVCSICEMEVTPLHMAAYIGDLYITSYLINHENEKSFTDDIQLCYNTRRQISYNDITPLWFALLRGHEHIVKLFLTLGKPLAPPCHFGSGLQVCLQEGFTSLALMILRAGYNLEDDMEWIENGNYPTNDVEVKNKIDSLLEEPRPLLEWCCFSLREKFGVNLDGYLAESKAPKKICDVLTFRDLLRSSDNKTLGNSGNDNLLQSAVSEEEISKNLQSAVSEEEISKNLQSAVSEEEISITLQSAVSEEAISKTLQSAAEMCENLQQMSEDFQTCA